VDDSMLDLVVLARLQGVLNGAENVVAVVGMQARDPLVEGPPELALVSDRRGAPSSGPMS
jgi:hypothetical protein